MWANGPEIIFVISSDFFLAQTGCQQSVFGSGGVPTAWKLVVSHAEHSFLLCERIFSRRLA